MTTLLLTITVSTYNRVERLEKCLQNIFLMTKSLENPDEVEVVVVDNASTDKTQLYLKEIAEPNFRVVRNSVNQGMLGNLNVCALNAKGLYVWCIGDDDFILPGALNKIVQTIKLYSSPIIYLNYGHQEQNGEAPNSFKIKPLATQKVVSGFLPLYEAVQANSNLMTAIYALVFRRDIAVLCYSVVSNSPPFSTLESCVPTTCFILSLSPETLIYWIAEPMIAVDLRVSWMEFAPIWILERFPELMLSLIDWSGQRINLQFVYEEMKDGIRHWLLAPKEVYTLPNSYRFLRAITNMYGTQEDIDFIIENRSKRH